MHVTGCMIWPLCAARLTKRKKLTADLVQQFPNDPGTSYFRGRDAELDGKYPQALAYFLDCIKTLNNFAPAFRRAGLNEFKLGKTRRELNI